MWRARSKGQRRTHRHHAAGRLGSGALARGPAVRDGAWKAKVASVRSRNAVPGSAKQRVLSETRGARGDRPGFGTFGRYAETLAAQMPPDMRDAYEFTKGRRGLVPGPHRIWLANPRPSTTIVPSDEYRKHLTLMNVAIGIVTNLSTLGGSPPARTTAREDQRGAGPPARGHGGLLLRSRTTRGGSTMDGRNSRPFRPRAEGEKGVMPRLLFQMHSGLGACARMAADGPRASRRCRQATPRRRTSLSPAMRAPCRPAWSADRTADYGAGP